MQAEDGVLSSRTEVRRADLKCLRQTPTRFSHNTGYCLDFFYGQGGSAVRFFLGIFLWRLSPIILRFFKVLSVLGFFSEGFSERALEWESGVLGDVFLVTKMPVLRPENSKEKILPVLGFFRSSIFVTARFCGGFWATSSGICIGCVFAGSGSAFLYGFSYLIQGVLVSCCSRDSGAVVSGFVCSSLLFLLLLPPFFLGAGLGSLSFSSVFLPTGPHRLFEAGPA